MQDEVDSGACALLAGGVGGLEDEGGLCGEEEAGGVEEGVSREEDELVGEDGAPYYCCELFRSVRYIVFFIGH